MVSPSELGPRELFELHEHQGERIADREHDRDARRWSEAVRTWLLDDTHVNDHITQYPEFSIGV